MIASLKGSIRHFTFLQILNLEDNCISDLHKVLETVHSFQFLRQLVLKGNPCCLESNYRLHTIHRVPSLHVLDYHVVTDQERQSVQNFIGIGLNTENLAFGKAAIARTGDWSKKVPQVSKLERTLRRTVEGIKNDKDNESTTKNTIKSAGQFGKSNINYSANLLEGSYTQKDYFRLYSWKVNVEEDDLKKQKPDSRTVDKVATSKLDIEVSLVDV